MSLNIKQILHELLLNIKIYSFDVGNIQRREVEGEGEGE